MKRILSETVPGIPLGLVLLLPCLLIFSLHLPTLFEDPGIGWHLQSGHLILENGGVVGNDPFTWTALEKEWIQFEWLFDALLAATELAGGPTLVAALAALLFSLIGVLWTARMVSYQVHPVLAICLSGWGLLIVSWHALARPHLFTYLFFPLTLWILERFCRTSHLRDLLPLVPIVLLWTNLHGGFVILFPTVGLWILGRAIEAWRDKDLEAGRQALILCGVGFCLSLVSLINPYGIHLHFTILHILSLDCLTLWNEFKPPTFGAPVLQMILFESLFFSFLLLACSRPRQLSWPMRLLLVFLLFFALRSVRHINLWVLAVIPVYGLLFQSIAASFFSRWARDGRAFCQHQIKNASLWWVAIGFASLVWLGMHFGVASITEVDVTRTTLSKDSIHFLNQHRDRIQRPFNQNNLGGALTYHFGPHLKIFMDDRADLFGDDFVFERYLPIAQTEPGWAERLKEEKVDSLILKADSGLARAAREHPEWHIAFQDARIEIFFPSTGNRP